MNATEFLNRLQERFTNVRFTPLESEHELDVLIETPDSKQFNFYLWIEGGWSLMDIGARLKSKTNEYFWYNSWECLGENDSEWIEHIFSEVMEELDILLNHETRIIQRKGFFASSFELQYMNSKWTKLSKNRAIHSRIEVPKIDGRKHIYD